MDRSSKQSNETDSLGAQAQHTALADRLLTHDEAAAWLKISPETLYQWRHHQRHRIPAHKIGRLLRYKISDLIAFVESQREA